MYYGFQTKGRATAGEISLARIGDGKMKHKFVAFGCIARTNHAHSKECSRSGSLKNSLEMVK